MLDEIAEMGQTLADDAQTEEDKFLIDSKVGHVTAKLRHGKPTLVLWRNPSQSSFPILTILVNFWVIIVSLVF